MVRIIKKEQQAQGAFNGGQIVENKPVGFPREGGLLRPYSNLFYWAHAKAKVDSTIGLHPHQGFEICSFVLKGQIRHYDTKQKTWIPLEAGDVQIIRAGNGISHSEFMAEGSEMFQIWFDPNLDETLVKPAEYDDYAAATFPKMVEDGVELIHLIGGGSPFRMHTAGVRMQRLRWENGSATVELNENEVAGIYVLNGEVSINGETSPESAFAVVYQDEKIQLQSQGEADVFVLFSPLKVPYRTYSAG